MTTLANRKFSKVIDKYLETGNVTVDFDKATLVTSLNGEGFTPAESQQLVQDFGKNPVFKTIMEIVNASPVASEARSHVISVKSLQEELTGYGNVEEDEDIDLQEYINNLTDDEDEEVNWEQTTLEEFLSAIGQDNVEEFSSAIKQAEDIIGDLDDEDEIVIEIPGIGKAVLSKVGEIDLDEEEDEDYSPKELLSSILSKLMEDVYGNDELEDLKFAHAKASLDSLPKEIKGAIKMSVLSTLGSVLIENARESNIPENELNEIVEIIVKMIGEADRISGENLPEPSDFITAISNVLEQYL